MEPTSKFGHVLRILWGLMALFCFVGVLTKGTQAAIASIVVATMWALTRIIHEGTASLRALTSRPEPPPDNSDG